MQNIPTSISFRLFIYSCLTQEMLYESDPYVHTIWQLFKGKITFLLTLQTRQKLTSVFI